MGWHMNLILNDKSIQKLEKYFDTLCYKEQLRAKRKMMTKISSEARKEVRYLAKRDRGMRGSGKFKLGKRISYKAGKQNLKTSTPTQIRLQESMTSGRFVTKSGSIRQGKTSVNFVDMRIRKSNFRLFNAFRSIKMPHMVFQWVDKIRKLKAVKINLAHAITGKIGSKHMDKEISNIIDKGTDKYFDDVFRKMQK